jgi:biopolymer transport protein ExbB/TolQ
MKRIFLILLIGIISLAVSAQTADSTLIKEVKLLKKEVQKLQKSGNNHNAMISKLKKAHQEDMKGVSVSLEENSKKIAAIDSRLNELKASLDEHINSSGTRLDNLEKWTKQMVMIQFILLGVLFIILLIMIIVNRQKITKAFTTLEAKVDNEKENLHAEVSKLLSKHEEDMKALKDELNKKNK